MEEGKKRIKYGTPKLVSLGPNLVGSSATCTTGSGGTSGVCTTGPLDGGCGGGPGNAGPGCTNGQADNVA